MTGQYKTVTGVCYEDDVFERTEKFIFTNRKSVPGGLTAKFIQNDELQHVPQRCMDYFKNHKAYHGDASIERGEVQWMAGM